MPKKPVPPPQPRPAPLWQRAIERFHAPFDARTTSDYAATISDWAELPGPERQGHGMHLLFRISGGLADIALNLREIRVLLARELPAIRKRLGDLESLVDEHGSTIAAAGRPNAGDEPEDDDADGGDPDAEAGLESDEDLAREFEQQQAQRTPAKAPAPAPGQKPVAETPRPVETVVPTEIIPAPAKPARTPKKKPVIIDVVPS